VLKLRCLDVVEMHDLLRVALLYRRRLVRLDERPVTPELARVDVPASVLFGSPLSSLEEDQRLVAARDEMVWPRSRWKADEMARFHRDSQRADSHGALAAQDVAPLLLDGVTMPVRPGKAGLDRTDVDTHVRQACCVAGATDDRADSLGCHEAGAFLSGQIPDVDDAGRAIHDRDGIELRPTASTHADSARAGEQCLAR
jgi:hypothetical protein